MGLPLNKPNQLDQTNLTGQHKTNGQAKSNFGVRIFDPSTVQHDVPESLPDHNMWCDRRSAMIESVVRCVDHSGLGVWLVKRVVDDVLAGTIDGAEVKRLLRLMDSKSDIANRGAYFNSSIRRIYRESGVPL